MIMKKKVTPSVILLFLLLLVFTALIGCGSSGDAPVVADVSVTGVTLNKTSTSIPVGSTEQLTATIAPANATNQNVTWSTSDAGKATVSLSGLVTAVAAGTATITVTTVDGGFAATCTVTVPNLYVDHGAASGGDGTTPGLSGTNCAFQTIQAAINAASSGYTINVAAGTYTEQPLIQKDLTLIGAGINQTIVKAPTSGRATFPGTTRWFNLDGSSTGDSGWLSDYILAAYPTDWNGTALTGTPISVKVTGFTLDANNQTTTANRFTGVFFGSVKGATIADAGLFTSEVKGFPVAYNSASGVRILGDSKLTIDHNTIGYTVSGITSYGDASTAPDPVVAVTYNTVNYSQSASTGGDEEAIVLSSGATGTIDHNTIANGNSGIDLYGARNDIGSTISNNTLSNLVADVSAWGGGISLAENSTGNTITGNSVTSSALGILVGDGSSNNTFTGNTITNNATGAQVEAYEGGADSTVPTGLVFHNNSFVGNTVKGFDNETASVVDATSNWWGAASGPGVVGPGTGDKVSTNVNFTPWLTVAP